MADATGRAILLAGASGLIGAHVLEALLGAADPALRVVVPARRALASRDSRVRVVEHALADPGQDARLAEALRSALDGRALEAYVCCLGTTIAVAGSQAAFVAVDRELPMRLAAIAKSLGARHAIAVTSVGADPRSRNFYLRTKGELEADLAAAGFARVDFLRPGLLLGSRSESRPTEALMRSLAPIWNPLLAGSLRRYRAIRADSVARAAVALLDSVAPGVHVHEHDELLRRASG